MNIPWKSKGILLTAPLTEELDDVIKFIDEYLAPRGFNLIVLQIRYRYRFKRHPEVCGYDALSSNDIKRLLAVCKKNNIKLIPKMNLMGHQSGFHNEPTDGILHGHSKIEADIPDGLLRAYPDFDEQRDIREIYYARSICLSHKGAKSVIFDLIDEMMDAFETDAIHIGCDEGFNLGICPKCSSVPVADLISGWINSINEHVRARGGKLLIWGDRLLSAIETGYGEWEASANGTDSSINMISKDVIICDWHYEDCPEYKSVDIFADAGFNIILCPWKNRSNLEKFLNYAKNHDHGHIRGVLMTTWCGSGDLAKILLYGEAGKWKFTEEIAKTIDEIF
jgi:hypothetical protein